MKVTLVREVMHCQYDGKSVVSLEMVDVEIAWPDGTEQRIREEKDNQYKVAGCWRIAEVASV